MVKDRIQYMLSRMVSMLSCASVMVKGSLMACWRCGLNVEAHCLFTRQQAWMLREERLRHVESTMRMMSRDGNGGGNGELNGDASRVCV